MGRITCGMLQPLVFGRGRGGELETRIEWCSALSAGGGVGGGGEEAVQRQTLPLSAGFPLERGRGGVCGLDWRYCWVLGGPFVILPTLIH